MNVSRLFHSTITLSLLLISVPLVAQEGSAVFSDTVNVEVVNVEVVVTDKDGKPITGLTAADFRVLEDGQPVEIVNFYEVAEEPGLPVAAGQVTAESTRPPVQTQRLNLVIFVDDVNTHPRNRTRLFAGLRKFLEAQGSVIDQMMLVSMNDRVRVVEPFTADKSRILASFAGIEKQSGFQAAFEGERRIFMSRVQRANLASPGGSSVSTGPPGGGFREHPCSNDDFEDSIRVAIDLAHTTRSLTERRIMSLRVTVSSLNAFSATLGGLPGRKALLYLSDGLPVRPDDVLSEAWAAKFDSWAQTNESEIRNCLSFPDAGGTFQRMITGLGASDFDLHQDIDRLATNASDNNVIFYPLSIAGRGAGLVGADSGGSTGGIVRAAQLAEAQTRDASLLQMADDTGGIAMTRSANVDQLIERIAGDFGYFYSLGYEPLDGKRDAEFHRIKVEVTRPNLKVRHTKGRHRRTWRDRLGDMTAAAAMFAIETNPLGVRLTVGDHVQQGRSTKVPVMVQIPFQNIQMISDGTNYTAQLTVLVTVNDEQDGLSEAQRFDLPIQIPNAQILAARSQAAAYPLELVMQPGSQQVAVAVRDHIAETASVVTLAVEVEGSRKGKSKKSKKRKG